MEKPTHLRKFNLTANQLLSLKYGASIMKNEIEIAILLQLYKDCSKHNVWKLLPDSGVCRSTFNIKIKAMIKNGWITNSHKRYYLSPKQKKFVDNYIYATFLVGECTKDLLGPTDP